MDNIKFEKFEDPAEIAKRIAKQELKVSPDEVVEIVEDFRKVLLDKDTTQFKYRVVNEEG